MSQNLELVGEFPASLVDEVGYNQEFFEGMVNTMRKEEFGEDAILDPADIEIQPDIVDDDMVFFVNSWHESGEAGSIGVFQQHGFSFRLKLGKADVYIVTNTEKEHAFKLTGRQALVVSRLCQLTAEKRRIEERRKKLGAPYGSWGKMGSPPV